MEHDETLFKYALHVLPSSRVPKGRKRGTFTVEKPDNHDLSQVIKVSQQWWRTSTVLLARNSSGKNTAVVAIPFSRRTSQPRNQTLASCMAGRFPVWATGKSTLNTMHWERHFFCRLPPPSPKSQPHYEKDTKPQQRDILQNSWPLNLVSESVKWKC